MSLRSVLRVFAVIAVCLSSIGINPVLAQTSNGNVSVTAARICGDQSLEVRWIGDSIDGINVSLSNTSDEWTSGWIEIPDVDAGTFTTPVGRNFDKVVAEVAFSDGSSQQIDIDTGTCADPGDNPDLNWYVTSVTFACDGTVTVNMSGSGTSWINFSLFRAGDSQYLTGGVIEPLQAGTVQQGWIDPAAWDPTVAVYASASRGDGGRDTPHPDSEIIRCEAPDPEPESTSITISGQVTDGDGQPINGAEICANVTWEFFYSCVSSARDGSYAINSVPNGEGILFIQAFGYQAQSLEFTAASEDITFSPVLRTYTWISISGIVTDEDGQTLPGVRVCLSSMASTGYNCTHTTAQGNYNFQTAERENIPPHDLFSGDRNWAFSSDRFTIDTQDIQINFVAVPRETPTENTTPYFGRVVDSDGNPIMQFAACDVGGRQSECFISNGESNLFELGLWGSDFAVSAQGCPTFNQYLYENFELPEDFDLGTITLDCEVGKTPTETPVVTPTETAPSTETPVITETPAVTPTETVTPEGENTLIVTITLPEGTSIEGAPYNLYAAQASVVFESEPYRSGVVGANNTIEITDLLPGTYKLVISPEGKGTIEAVIEVGDQPLTEVRLTVNKDGSVTIGDIAQVTPTTPTEEEKSDEVTALPTTGTGALNGSTGVLMMLGIAASALMMAGGLAVRQKRG